MLRGLGFRAQQENGFLGSKAGVQPWVRVQC